MFRITPLLQIKFQVQSFKLRADAEASAKFKVSRCIQVGTQLETLNLKLYIL